eukprot:TRINITY_DN22252_c0_g2_i1.p1 TRINITY_DN22252_c0_g2~~TRINITY_DN22252_c0_g2_i1.p1  ORF type:complete len:377 (+),score=71.38 TRINITY_DN22252_c0_g2_i1:85-1215(+)
MSQVAFIDCHCHLTSERFAHDLPHVLARAEKAGVRGIFVCSSSQLDMHRAVRLRDLHPGNIYACLGLHPLDFTFDPSFWKATRDIIVEAHTNGGVAAIGEIGLDFSAPLLREQAARAGTSEAEVKALQMASFEAQVQLALELGLPVNVHSRNAERQTLEVLAHLGARGVMHAYKGDVDMAVQAARNNRLLFSFPPSIVYKKEYQNVAKALPLEALLLETDSPSLAAGGPKERNEPAFIHLAAAKIADLHGVSLEAVADVTTRNALKLFGPLAEGLVKTVEAALASKASKTARWRKGSASQGNCSKGDDGDKEKDVSADVDALPPPPPASNTAEGVQRNRWQRASRGRASAGQVERPDVETLDRTLCSSAFGSAFCD